MATALCFVQGLLGRIPTALRILKELLRRAPTASSHTSVTLVTVPTDILHIILQLLYDTSPAEEERERYDHEICKGEYLLALSVTCRYMRAQTLPWIFREVYNWSRPGGGIWPETLWPFFMSVHIRDQSVRHPAHIALSPELCSVLSGMRSLTTVTVRLEASVPAELLGALSLAPCLTFLEIHQARFDGTTPSSPLPFATLKGLVVCISGFRGVVRSDTIDRRKEVANVVALLKSFNHSLTTLQISGDLLSPDFLSLTWLHLRSFIVTEHTPTPYIAVPELVSKMPALRDLSILFSADLSRDRDAGEMYPPFKLGTPGGGLLTHRSPLLTTITLSNLEPADPIFSQLPHSLESLHLLAMQDGYIPGPSSPGSLWEAPFTLTTIPIALESISHLQELTALSLTLDDFATADTILRIASVFPRLRFLQLGHATYSHGHQFCFDIRDDSILHALQCFSRLTHLRISLDFFERAIDAQDGPQGRAAQWLLEGLPGLCTVAFSWGRSWDDYGFENIIWRVWDRSVFLLPRAPPAFEPEPAEDVVYGVAIPPREQRST
ncbi:hypothetical protein DFH07DRAFT_954714 [Mycena maculata]|uniref:Uncharacterized protein n=1 Tax=Mycena maculata TaxID=230809 RepID=A0AAD7JNS4_9AGAR|nr:hypothetical protein DFH07DRAFT_954714 [Mycena maculata]